MNMKALLALSGILNLVLIANFFPSVNQTLGYRSGGAAKEIIQPFKIHAPNNENNSGLSDIQIEILGYGEIKYKQRQQKRNDLKYANILDVQACLSLNPDIDATYECY